MSIWKAEVPSGYLPVGHVVVKSHHKPSKSYVIKATPKADSDALVLPVSYDKIWYKMCNIGDGYGSESSNIGLWGYYTIQECINAVKEQHPTANGAAMSKTCPNKCSCWAEFKMQK